MNPFNKYETIGIFVSIAIMAGTLGIMRFKTDAFLTKVDVDDTQGAVVAVSQSTDANAAVLEATLKDAFSVDGELLDLVVDDVRVGTGDEVQNGDTVTVHYVGTTQDGVKFDSSYDRGQTFSFTIGKGIVIQGWEKGLIGMKVGGQRILVIPGNMAYGNRQVGVIPPNATLVFAVELLEIK